MSYDRKGPAGWVIHPGEILKEEFLKPMKLSGYSLAKALNVTPQRVSDIVLKKSGISADMAMRLAKFLGMSPEFWMNLQGAYELALAGRSLKKEIKKIKPRQEHVA